MKKSEVYHLAQIAVMMSPQISPENRLEILRVLMDEEDLARYIECRNETEMYTVETKENEE